MLQGYRIRGGGGAGLCIFLFSSLIWSPQRKGPVWWPCGQIYLSCSGKHSYILPRMNIIHLCLVQRITCGAHACSLGHTCHKLWSCGHSHCESGSFWRDILNLYASALAVILELGKRAQRKPERTWGVMVIDNPDPGAVKSWSSFPEDLLLRYQTKLHFFALLILNKTAVSQANKSLKYTSLSNLICSWNTIFTFSDEPDAGEFSAFHSRSAPALSSNIQHPTS